VTLNGEHTTAAANGDDLPGFFHANALEARAMPCMRSAKIKVTIVIRSGKKSWL